MPRAPARTGQPSVTTDVVHGHREDGLALTLDVHRGRSQRRGPHDDRERRVAIEVRARQILGRSARFIEQLRRSTTSLRTALALRERR
jgi:hypothetical protein